MSRFLLSVATWAVLAGCMVLALGLDYGSLSYPVTR